MLKEFKKFAMRGNVVDLAIGVILGGAFGKIVTSLVNDIIMPFFGLVLGGINFTKLKWVIGKQGETELVLNYGQFIQSTVDFVIMAFAIFLFIKAINKLKRKEDKAESCKLTREEELLTEIRDLLRDKR